MQIDRRLTLVGVLLIVLSMTMATQYATTNVNFSYNVVHPSNADIRFIASDNSSDNIHILRIATNSSTNRVMQLRFGPSLTTQLNTTYTAAFGIVNEENYSVTISHINVSMYNASSDYMQIWLHGDRDALQENDGTSINVWNKGSVSFDATSSVWVLGDGDNNPNTMNNGVGATIFTRWNETSHVRFSKDDTDAVNGTDDYVWVQISIDIPATAPDGWHSGIVWVHFRANTTPNKGG